MIRLVDPVFSVAGSTQATDLAKFLQGVDGAEDLISSLKVGPQLFSALAAAGTHSQNSVYEILGSKIRRYASDPGLSRSGVNLERYLGEYASKIFDNTLARGHIDVSDMGSYFVVGENVPRILSLFLCSPHHLTHEQQSLRYTEPSSFHVSKAVLNTGLGDYAASLLSECYMLYRKMVDSGLPKEDARSVLPLAVNSNITTLGGGREFTYIKILADNPGLELPSVVREAVESIHRSLSRVAPEVFRNRGANYEIRRYFPGPQLFAKRNAFVSKAVAEHRGARVSLLSFTDPGLGLDREAVHAGLEKPDPSFMVNLLHVRAVFLVRFSLEAAHQAIRHRTWNHDFQPLYEAAENFEYMVPPSVAASGFEAEYHRAQGLMHDFYRRVRDEVGASEALGFVSNAHYVYDIVEVDGWNMVGNLPLRTCEKAQWEIRGIAKAMASLIGWGSRDSGFNGNKTLSFYTLPPCHTFNVCFEDNSKEVCPIYRHKFMRYQPKLIQ